jgi:hypothetical protein
MKRAQRKKLSLLNPLQSIPRMFDWLFCDLGCAYGDKPARLILVCLLLVLLFAGIYGWQFGNIFSSKDTLEKYTQAIWYSFLTFFPTGIAHWKDLASFSALSIPFLKIFVLLENFLGFFFFVLFAILFGRKMLR